MFLASAAVLALEPAPQGLGVWHLPLIVPAALNAAGGFIVLGGAPRVRPCTSPPKCGSHSQSPTLHCSGATGESAGSGGAAGPHSTGTRMAAPTRCVVGSKGDSVALHRLVSAATYRAQLTLPATPCAPAQRRGAQYYAPAVHTRFVEPPTGCMYHGKAFGFDMAAPAACSGACVAQTLR